MSAGNGAYCNSFAKALAVVNSPPQKIDQRLSFGRISLILVDENVGVTRDRIRLRTSAFVIDTRRSSGVFAAEAEAAAVTASIEGSIKFPLAFLMWATGSLFCTAYANST